MKDYITTVFPPHILERDSKVRISIYMPTHRTAPDNKKDAIVFKNLVSSLENRGDYGPFVERLREIERDQDFWQHNFDSLAILMDEEELAIYRLPRNVEEYLAVGERFYLKPLIRNYQSDHRYYALGLSRDSFRLYSGNRYGFREVEVSDEDRLLVNVLGDEYERVRLNVGSHGGTAGTFYTHSDKSAEIKIDTQRFFNHVDSFIYENYTKDSKIPLILVSLSEHQATFREIAKNPQLVERGLHKSLESIDEKTLKKDLWEVLEPIYEEKTESLIKQYHVGINNANATKTIQETLVAILNDRVKTLVLQADNTVPGKIDVANASYELVDGGEDILNHLAQLALARGGEVIILPKDKMPEHLSVFSILRF